MGDQPFVHLHVHSQYSLLDSALRLNEVVERAKTLAMPAVALTDHGNMFGTVQFYKASKAAGIAPIIGCEVNLCANRKDKSKRDGDHLVLVAKSQEGYRNLVRLVSFGWVEGLSHGVPRIDWEQLGENRSNTSSVTTSGGLLRSHPYAVERVTPRSSAIEASRVS